MARLIVLFDLVVSVVALMAGLVSMWVHHDPGHVWAAYIALSYAVAAHGVDVARRIEARRQ